MPDTGVVVVARGFFFERTWVRQTLEKPGRPGWHRRAVGVWLRPENPLSAVVVVDTPREQVL